MARNAWFETVARGAAPRAEASACAGLRSLLAGSEKGVTYADNMAAFSELGMSPHVAGPAGAARPQHPRAGDRHLLPVIISPTGVQAVHPDGEVAVARAAAARGTAMSLSSFASKSRRGGRRGWRPAALPGLLAGRDGTTIARRLERARAAGAHAIIVTLDWSFSHGRDWAAPASPSASR